MKTIRDYLQEAKLKLQLENDNQLAKYLNWKPQSITKINNGGSISDINAERLARILKKDPMELIAVSNFQRAKNKEIKQIWLKLAKEKSKESRENHHDHI